ncbi:MAG: HD-GYP domain-containing protein [Thermoleophilaceae bacterium]
MRPYLPQALAATLLVVGAPVVAIVAWIALAAVDPAFLLALVVGGLMTLFAFAAGATLWKRRPESADIAFGELMIWGWLQRKRADDKLHEGADLLGLDRTGQPTKASRITPERQLEVLHQLTEALESKDPYTHGHSQRVERHSYRTAVQMGLPASAIEELRTAAALHDVGKIRIPTRILRKPGELTIEERAIVEEHVVVGSWMVSNVSSADVVSAVRHHHERWDGRGYPDGLAGTDIPLYARMIAVADAYDAITSTRPYRVSSGREHAVAVLEKEAGGQFDPMIVTAFVEALPVRLPVAGMFVLLAGPGAMWRRVAVWLKRAGAGNLAPTAATLGAVVTLGTFVPSLAPPQHPAPAIVAEAAPSETESSARPAPKAPERRKPKPKAPKRDSEIAAAEQPAQAAVVLGDEMSNAEPAPATEPEPEPQVEPEPTPTESERCGHGPPDGEGSESSAEGREQAYESSDGRGPNHCP